MSAAIPCADSARFCWPGDVDATCGDFSLPALFKILSEQFPSDYDSEVQDRAEHARLIHLGRRDLTPYGCCELAYELAIEGGA